MIDLQISEHTKTPIYRRIANAVSEAVAAGRISPGDKLPAESALAKDLGINALTVSRGYAFLENQGIIRQRRGTGTFVEADALQIVRRAGQRRITTLKVILGEPSLAQCRRETAFISMNILDGLRAVVDTRATHWEFLESLNRTCLPEIVEGDAIAFLGTREFDTQLLHELAYNGTPIVAIGSHEQLPSVARVTYEKVHATRLACQHLLDCGYKRIGYIGIKALSFFPISTKYYTFNSLLHEAGLDVQARFVRHVNVEPGRAYAAARDIVQSGATPDAFFVDTDYKAMEVICALNDAGFRVPEDIGVVAYDDIPESAHFTPPLTTIAVPRREMGRAAGQMLMDWSDDQPATKEVVLTSSLVVRQSTRGTAKS